jgi:hypothetical protein
MFDLTKKVQLDSESHKKYVALRIALHIVFFIGVFFIAYNILFPAISLVFSFANINSPKNNLNLSTATLKSDALTKGSVTDNDVLGFAAHPSGIFSHAIVEITANNKSGNIENASVEIRKSYEAFFYPTGDPVGFKDGTLLVADNAYYIVSDGALRKFSNVALTAQLGYSKNSFMSVSQDDLKYNKPGDDITNGATNYPDDTLFAIGDTYYQLKDQQLFPFVSTRAFFSQFEANQAIIKDDSFLKNHTVSDKQLGFADGTLASFDQSVFILSEGKSYPISNAETFVKMGFDWNNVIAVNSEELGIYAKQKQFTYNQPHPDGTLFLDQKINKYFVIQNEEKHPIENAAVAKTYAEQKPVLVSLQESEVSVSCQLKKKFLSLSNTYTCNIPLNSIDSFLGFDFQIDAKFTDNEKISNINTTFYTSPTWENFILFLSKIKGGLITNYTQQ